MPFALHTTHTHTHTVFDTSICLHTPTNLLLLLLLRSSNPYGQNGEMAEEFGWLVKNIWLGGYKSMSPRDLKVGGAAASMGEGYIGQKVGELLRELLLQVPMPRGSFFLCFTLVWIVLCTVCVLTYVATIAACLCFSTILAYVLCNRCGIPHVFACDRMCSSVPFLQCMIYV